jgi:hypothetical protein
MILLFSIPDTGVRGSPPVVTVPPSSEGRHLEPTAWKSNLSNEHRAVALSLWIFVLFLIYVTA